MKKASSYFIVLALVLSLFPPVLAAAAGPELITDEADLSAMTASGQYILANDITLSASWTPIATFSGSLDGAGHTISGLSDALFAETRNASINDLSLSADISKTIDPSITGEQKVAAVSLNMYGGSLTNVNVSGTIRISAIRQNVGGLVAFMDSGTIDGCEFSGAIHSSNSYSASASYVGGFIGITWFQSSPGVVKNSRVSGSISVSGANEIYVGGFIGEHVVVNQPAGGFWRNISSADVDVRGAESVYAGALIGYTSFQASVDECAAMGASVDASATNKALAGGITGYSDYNTHIYNSISVGGNYSAAVIGSSTVSYAGAISGGIDASDKAVYIEELICTGNTVTASKPGGIVGWQGGVSQIKNSYCDGSLDPVAVCTDARSKQVNTRRLTSAEFTDRASYSDWPVAPDPNAFERIWILPAGKAPALLWTARNIPAGTYLVDAGAATAGNGLEVGGYTGVAGEDIFVTLAEAVASAYGGASIEISSNVTSYSFAAGASSVTLDADGGAIARLIAPSASQLTLPTPTRSGYTFSGWSDGTSDYTAGETVALPGGSVVFTAKWTAVGSPVVDPGNTGNTGTTEYADGSVVTITESTGTGEDGSTVLDKTETVSAADGTVKETHTKTTVSGDGTGIVSESTTMVTDAYGAVISTTTTSSETKVNTETGVSSTIGKTTTTDTYGTSENAFAQATVTAAPTTTGSAATAQVDEALAGALLSELKAGAAAAAESGGSVSTNLTINAATGEAGISDASVTLPAKLISEASADMGASITIRTDAGAIELTPEALSAIAQVGGVNVTLNIRAAESGMLPEAQKNAASAGVPFEIEIIVTDSEGNQTAVSSLGAGQQTVMLPYGLAKNENPSNLTVYYIGGDGVSQKMGGNYNPITGMMEFTSNHNSLYLIVNEAVARFADVELSAWYYPYVNYAVDNGLMNGVSRSSFMPERELSRAMLVTMLYRMEGEPSVSGSAGFSDVSEGQWYSAAVNWAVRRGIVTGFEDDTFRPLEDITREQMAAVLYRYAAFKGCDVSGSVSLGGYTDASFVSAWVSAPMRWAVAEKLITGVTATRLVPQGTADRAQASAMLARFCENIIG